MQHIGDFFHKLTKKWPCFLFFFAAWKMGATPKNNFIRVSDHLSGFENYTFFNFQKIFFHSTLIIMCQASRASTSFHFFCVNLSCSADRPTTYEHQKLYSETSAIFPVCLCFYFLVVPRVFAIPFKLFCVLYSCAFFRYGYYGGIHEEYV